MTIDGNHIEICKFQSRSDLGYKKVIIVLLNFIATYINPAVSRNPRDSRDAAGSAPEVLNHDDPHTSEADRVQAKYVPACPPLGSLANIRSSARPSLRNVEQLRRDTIKQLTAQPGQTPGQRRLVKKLELHLMVVKEVATLAEQDHTMPAAQAVISLEIPLQDCLSKIPSLREHDISNLTDDI